MQLLTSGLRVFSWLTLGAALFLLAAVGLWYASGGRLLIVQSSSMTPKFSPADVVLIRPVQAANIVPGQVVSYYNPNKLGQIISHRVVSKGPKNTFVTKGDNRPDKDLPVPESKLIGRVVAVAPGLGGLLRLLKSGYGIMTMYLLLSVVLSINVGRFIARSNPSYELYGQ